jgi:DNA-binding NarL/FixJ family response regulator
MLRKPEIIIVDDHIAFRQGLISILTIEKIATVIAEASNGTELMVLLSKFKPDLVLMDIEIPGMNGLEATGKAMKMMPGLKIIAYTMFEDDEYYNKMIELGVRGFLLKSGGINELEKAIGIVMKDKTYFSGKLMKKPSANRAVKPI